LVSKRPARCAKVIDLAGNGLMPYHNVKKPQQLDLGERR
jgi:hypothetical protein